MNNIKKIIGIFFTLIAMLTLTFTFALAGEKTKLSDGVKKIMDEPRFKYSSWGILAVDQETGEILESLNRDKMFYPASTTKAFTVAAAMDMLGSDFRFNTPVYARGKTDKNGKLDGDLILVGTGDINMGGRTLPDGSIAFTNADHTEANTLGIGELTKTNTLAGLQSLARQVVKSGIKEITGNVIIDDRLYGQNDPEAPSDKQTLSPIAINDNLIDFTITPTEPGKPAKVEWSPKNSFYRITSEIVTGNQGDENDPEIVKASGEGNRLVIRGKVSPKDPILMTYQVENPAEFARSLFVDALKQAGVKLPDYGKIRNYPCSLPDPGQYKNLKAAANLESPPFSEYARLILKVSHNMGANTLIYLMAINKGKTSFADGMALEKPFLEKAGVDTESLSLADGEGGALGDRISPTAMVALLKYMTGRKDFKCFYNALPIMGVDGTLFTAASKDSPIVGKVRGKTGTFITTNYMNNSLFLGAKGLAGYMTTEKGRKVIFAIYINNMNAKDVNEVMKTGKVLGDICESMYRTH